MLSACVKRVEIVCKQHGKRGGILSTAYRTLSNMVYGSRVQPAVFQRFFPVFLPAYSTASFSPSPLVEHIFYTVSTAPTTTHHQINSKERL